MKYGFDEYGNFFNIVKEEADHYIVKHESQTRLQRKSAEFFTDIASAIFLPWTTVGS